MSEATTIVSFPGFGIGEMELNKIVFTLFGSAIAEVLYLTHIFHIYPN